jgi:N-glycosylase/DNA lyase
MRKDAWSAGRVAILNVETLKYFYIKAPNFDLAHTLECGQVFRWAKIGECEYEGVLDQAIIKVAQIKKRLFIQTSNPKITPSCIKSYFDLTLDLAYIYNRISKDKHIKAAISAFKGLRIIRQPLWECIASFIISSYNNIPRIKGIIYNLSGCAGQPLFLNQDVNYAFPAPRTISDLSISRLRGCGAGFRAPYLKKAAIAFLKGRITEETLAMRPYEEAKALLMGLAGIGDKVADCILLYSAHRFEAFPVDVWIKRVMERLYFRGKKTPERKIRQFASEYFGEYAGYAQQYLYHYVRKEGR